MAETVPLWATIVTGLLTTLFGAGGAAGIIKAWLTYKTRGMELDADGAKSVAQIEGEATRRLEAELRGQLDDLKARVEKLEVELGESKQREDHLERQLQRERRKMAVEVGRLQDRVELAVGQLFAAEIALKADDPTQALLMISATQEYLGDIQGQSQHLGDLATEPSDGEDT